MLRDETRRQEDSFLVYQSYIKNVITKYISNRDQQVTAMCAQDK